MRCTFCGTDLDQDPKAYEGYFGDYCGACLAEANRLWDEYLPRYIFASIIIVLAIIFQ